MKLVALCLMFAIVAEARLLYRHTPGMGMKRHQKKGLLFVGSLEEEDLLLELESLQTNDKGAWTDDYLNMDHSDPERGSNGDYEWLLSARIAEVVDGTCPVPCANDQVIAMEVDIEAVEDDDQYFTDCLDLQDDASMPSKGFYCM